MTVSLVVMAIPERRKQAFVKSSATIHVVKIKPKLRVMVVLEDLTPRRVRKRMKESFWDLSGDVLLIKNLSQQTDF